MIKVLSINVASVGSLFVNEGDGIQRTMSGIHKQPVAGLVQVSRLGLAGDEQADRKLHGGIKKAVYAYPIEHYAFWEEQRKRITKLDEALSPGAVGENLTLQGLLETEAWVGDRLQIGSALLEITEPRTPCFKFNAKMRLSHAAKLMVQSGYSGFYLRVIEEGSMQAGDAVTIVPGVRRNTIAMLNDQRRTGPQFDLF